MTTMTLTSATPMRLDLEAQDCALVMHANGDVELLLPAHADTDKLTDVEVRAAALMALLANSGPWRGRLDALTRDFLALRDAPAAAASVAGAEVLH